MKNLAEPAETAVLFEYEISDGECEIIKYLADEQEECEIPDTIKGCVVTSIAKYAFSGHGELSCVRLPAGLKSIGAHAFYNCRNLRRITLYNVLCDIGDGAFKNCAKVSRIQLIQNGGSMKCLKALLEEMNQEMLVMINYGSQMSALVFPYYLYEYEENTPGRIINQITIGSGVHYRETAGGADVDYVRYDRIFEVEKNIDVNESAWKVAFWRLRFPYALSPEDAAGYKEYLMERKSDIALKLIKAEMYEELGVFLDMSEAAREEIKAITERARESGMIKAVGILLQYEKEKWQVKKKSYEFE